MKNLPSIRLKPKAGNRARSGAPWIFSNEIRMDEAAKSLPAGSLVTVAGDDGRSFGVGYFNPKTLITVRLFGAPDAAIDGSFFVARLARARDLRASLFDKPFYRLVNSEGDQMPGLVIDRFDDVCVVQISTAGMEIQLEHILAALKETVSPRTIVLRADAPARALEGLPAYVRVAQGEERTHIAVEEDGARYFADVSRGQKTGWYYDQRESRAFLAALAKDKSVLDACCYTGGFAIAAALAGARDVSGIDSSSPALTLAEEAATANGVARRCKFVKADVFDELQRLTGADETFDVVAADPPPFVKSRQDLEAGARAYRKIARLATAVTRTNGILLLASCSHNISSERFAHECAIGIGRAGRSARLLRQAGAGPDHPVHPMLPESAYLKTMVYALD